MFDNGYRKKLRKLQKDRERLDQEYGKELKAAPREKREDVKGMWHAEGGQVQEEINELMSDRVRQLAERYDVALPKVEEGDHWERMYQVGQRLILTTLGREVTRAKIAVERKNTREVLALVLGIIATCGSLTVAILTLILKK